MPIPTRSESPKPSEIPRALRQKNLSQSIRASQVDTKVASQTVSAHKGSTRSKIARPPPSTRTASNAIKLTAATTQSLPAVPVKTAFEPSVTSFHTVPTQPRASAQSRQHDTTVPGTRILSMDQARPTSAATSSRGTRVLQTNTADKSGHIPRQLPSSLQRPKSSINKIGVKTPPTSVDIQDIAHADSRLEDELLQLALTCDGSMNTLKQFRSKVSEHLDSKRQALEQRQHDLSLLSNNHTAGTSRSALRAWLDDHHGYLDSQQIQVLSDAIKAVVQVDHELHQPDGPLSHFQRWLATTMASRQARQSTSPAPPVMEASPPLTAGWQRSMLDLERKVELVIVTLQDFASICPHAASGIDITVEQNLRMAENLRGQISLALQIEQTLLEREEAWMQEQLQVVMKEVEVLGGRQHEAAWNS